MAHYDELREALAEKQRETNKIRSLTKTSHFEIMHGLAEIKKEIADLKTHINELHERIMYEDEQ